MKQHGAHNAHHADGDERILIAGVRDDLAAGNQCYGADPRVCQLVDDERAPRLVTTKFGDQRLPRDQPDGLGEPRQRHQRTDDQPIGRQRHPEVKRCPGDQRDRDRVAASQPRGNVGADQLPRHHAADEPQRHLCPLLVAIAQPFDQETVDEGIKPEPCCDADE